MGNDKEYQLASLAEQIRQADMMSRDRNASLAEQRRASQQAELLRRDQFDLQKEESGLGSDRYDQQRKDEQARLAYDREQDAINRKRDEEQDAWEKKKYYDSLNRITTGSGGAYGATSYQPNMTGIGRY